MNNTIAIIRSIRALQEPRPTTIVKSSVTAASIRAQLAGRRS